MKKTLGLAGVLAVALGLTVASPAAAATTEVVYEATATEQGWNVTFQRGAGSLSWTADGVQLSTPEDPASSKLTFGTTEQFALADLAELTYDVKHVQAGSLPTQRVAINLAGDWNGPAEGGSFILVYEPLYTYEAWEFVDEQTFDAVADGTARWWTPTVGIPGFPASASYKPLDEVKALLPNATISQVAVNQGGGNDGLIDVVKSLTVNEKTWAFKAGAPVPPPVVLGSVDECKKGGWETSELPVFKNQGQCVSYFVRSVK